mmetsp:Transcript_25994/g.72604  ORF Transcript_25994/g.72604 Transcript_25994/m.72604 type:complete len:285 (-) Transcript_25994:8-862(-)
MEFGLHLVATELELLYDVRNLFETVGIQKCPPGRMGNQQERVLLEQDHLVGLTHLAHVRELLLQDANVRHKEVHDLRPRLEERLVPNGSPEACDRNTWRDVRELGLEAANGLLLLALVHEIHLVNEAENPRAWGECTQGVDGVSEVGHVLRLLRLLRPRSILRHAFVAHCHEDVNENLCVLEDRLPLRFEIVFHEHVLPSAIPKVQPQVAQEAQRRVLDHVGLVKPVGVARKVISEDDGLHGRLARSGSAHEQHLRMAGLRHPDPLVTCPPKPALNLAVAHRRP